MRFQLFHETLHPRAFELEDTVCLSGSDIIHYFLVIIVDLLHIQIRAFAAHHIYRVLDDRQSTQPQEIHFQKSQFLKRSHGELGRDRPVCRS